MKIAITGHRPNKLGNDYNLTSPLIKAIEKKLILVVHDYQPKYMISGMALGIDTLWAELAVKLGVPLIAALPFKGQHTAWPSKSQDRYWNLLKQANQIHICDTNKTYTKFEDFLEADITEFTGSKMQKRNIWMVDECNLLVAVWNGTPGGTANCVNYANETRKTIRIDPRNLTY